MSISPDFYIYEDNQSCIKIIKSPKFSSRTKLHIKNSERDSVIDWITAYYVVKDVPDMNQEGCINKKAGINQI